MMSIGQPLISSTGQNFYQGGTGTYTNQFKHDTHVNHLRSDSYTNHLKPETVYTGLMKNSNPVISNFEPTSKPLYESLHQISKSYASNYREDSGFDPEKFLSDNYHKTHHLNPAHTSHHNISHNIHNLSNHEFGAHLGGK